MKEKIEKNIDKYSNGTINREYHVNSKNQWHGLYKNYYSNGNLCYETSFKKDVWHGLRKDKWNDGSFNKYDIWKNDEDFGMDTGWLHPRTVAFQLKYSF